MTPTPNTLKPGQRQHKASGWIREAIPYTTNYKIIPADDSGIRTVAFMSARSWANLPNDDRANIDRDRVVLIDGPELPAWAIDWLEKANAKSCARARQAFAAALDDADWNEDRRTWGDY